MTRSPSDEYRDRLSRRQDDAGRLAASDRLLSSARLAVFLVAVVLLAMWWRGAIGPWWLVLPALTFGGLVRSHDRVIGARLAAERCIDFYQRGLGRIGDNWSGHGESGERFLDDGHPYAADLDLFGGGSLFQLLSIARTRAGEERLAEWLLTPALPVEIRRRQDAVTELTSALDLREALSLAGTEVRASVNSEALLTWAEETAGLQSRALRVAAVALSALALASAGYAFTVGDYAPLVAVVTLEVLFSIPLRARVQRVLHAADSPARELDVLAHILDRLERQRFEAPKLVATQRSLETQGVRASAAIGSLHRLVELHDWQHNQFFAPLAASVLWGTHLAIAVERWRHVYGLHVRTWLQAVGDFEALASLSAYRYEHPDDVWPEIVDGASGFHGKALAHPLVAQARAVRNDVELWGDTRMLVVSGSNMSGKSTLLRTVGINAVLAFAGAPVRAASLRISPLAVGATLRIQDSLQEGRSRFYAEITRLRQISDLARGPVRLLFLLDELFHGTNSHDRLAGASGLLRSLLDQGAIGLVTTHDLALTAVADSLTPRAVNVHFEDRFEHGEVSFDYRVKAGPVTRSNALALMRAVGLDVGDDVPADPGCD